MTRTATTTDKPNDLALDLFIKASDLAEHLGIRVMRIGESSVLDFAVGREGTIESGIALSEICMGGLGQIEFIASGGQMGLPQIRVTTDKPLLACIGSQYAGWPISHQKYFAMGSGPMRIPRGNEDILMNYHLHHPSTHAVGVLEANEIPNESVVELIASQCNVAPGGVFLCVARTASWPGTVQVVARSIEVAMHKLFELNFDLGTIKHGSGLAPLPPVAGDDMTALGWTNDAILYGAKVELTVETTDEAVEKVADQIPSCSSTEFGTPFLDIFNKYEKDFYKIDKMLFSPAEITITNRSTGRVFHAGKIRNDILKRSFGIE